MPDLVLLGLQHRMRSLNVLGLQGLPLVSQHALQVPLLIQQLLLALLEASIARSKRVHLILELQWYDATEASALG